MLSVGRPVAGRAKGLWWQLCRGAQTKSVNTTKIEDLKKKFQLSDINWFPGHMKGAADKIEKRIQAADLVRLLPTQSSLSRHFSTHTLTLVQCSWHPLSMKVSADSDALPSPQVIEVRDARVPLSSACGRLEPLLKNRRHIVILNKCDMLLPSEQKAWKRHFDLRRDHPFLTALRHVSLSCRRALMQTCAWA